MIKIRVAGGSLTMELVIRKITDPNNFQSCLQTLVDTDPAEKVAVALSGVRLDTNCVWCIHDTCTFSDDCLQISFIFASHIMTAGLQNIRMYRQS